MARERLLQSNLSNILSNPYAKKKTTKDLWDVLKERHTKHKDKSKACLVVNYLDFSYYESKKIGPQVMELEVVVKKFKLENVIVCDVFFASTILNKLSDWLNGFTTDIHR